MCFNYKTVLVNIFGCNSLMFWIFPSSKFLGSFLPVDSVSMIVKLLSKRFYNLYCHQEKAMALHSSTLAWKIPWTEEPGRLQSMGSLQSDTIECLHFHFSLWCIGEGNGNPLQCSCLENPRDGEAWWAAVYGGQTVGHDWGDLAAAAAA